MGESKAEYMVINAESLNELETSVTDLLGKGWEVAPGFFVLRYEYENRKGYSESDTIYYQPMTRKALQ